MNLLRRSVVLALVGGLSLCGPAALGAPLSGGSPERVTAIAARMSTISALPSQADRISAARDRTIGHWRSRRRETAASR